MRALAQHRFGKVEAMTHGGLHCSAMRLVKGMDDLSHWTSSLIKSWRGVRISLGSDRLDLQQPFVVDGFGDHDRRCGFVYPEHLAANGAVGHHLALVRQERVDLDQVLDTEAGRIQHSDHIAPGLLALRLEPFGYAAV